MILVVLVVLVVLLVVVVLLVTSGFAGTSVHIINIRQSVDCDNEKVVLLIHNLYVVHIILYTMLMGYNTFHECKSKKSKICIL